MRNPKKIVDISMQKALTSTDKSIHCSDTATTGAAEHQENELDKIMVKAFLTTLAEVALNIARRKNNSQDKDR
jgi:hypothetical protein